jgi:hypothetical protein
MSTPNGKPSNFLLCIPKCGADGSNWSIYKSHFSFTANTAGLADHLDEKHVTSTVPTTASPPTTADTITLEAHKKELKTFKSGQAIVKQVFLRVEDENAVELWTKVMNEFEKKSKMVTVDLQCRLQNECCTETGNV